MFEAAEKTLDVLQAVAVERDRQEQIGEAKRERGESWSTCADPKMPGGDDRRFTVLTEEVGEVAKALNERDEYDTGLFPAALRTELVQVAAVAVAWVEAIDAADAFEKRMDALADAAEAA